MSEAVDFVIVGAGMAGLSAAGQLARRGHKVAVFEKHGKLGGYAQYFGKEPTYDSSTHLIGGTGPGGWTHAALEEIGVLDRIELLPLNPVYSAVWPEHDYVALPDRERFIQELSTLWPSDAAGIRRFFDEVDVIGSAYLQPGADDSPLAKHATDTLSQFLDRFTKNEELRAALSALWLFAGLPPERLSAVHYAMLWHTFHTQGSATVKGGIKLLSQAMADVVTERGGTVETRVSVANIMRERGRVLGVRLEDGRVVRAGAVISTVSPADTFEDLLAAEGQTPAGYPPLRGFVASISAMQVHLLVNGPVDLPARSTILHSTYDLDEAYIDLQRETPDLGGMVVSVLDHGDPERAPEGKHLVSVFTLSPYSRYDNWNAPFDARRGPGYRSLEDYVALRERLGDVMVAAAEEIIPDLAARTEARKVGTPLTMERYTHNTGGAAFGWANIPEQSGGLRPGPETPFRGLFMAGHWTYPGGSIAAALQSGRIAAEAAERTG